MEGVASAEKGLLLKTIFCAIMELKKALLSTLAMAAFFIGALAIFMFVACSDQSGKTTKYKASKTIYHSSPAEDEEYYPDPYIDSYLESQEPDRDMNADYVGRDCY